MKASLLIIFFFILFSESVYAVCTETANRLNATAGSVCTANNATYTQITAGQPVFQATNATINANAPVTLINTLSQPNGIGARAQGGGTINFNALVTIETGQNTGDTEGSEGIIALTNSTVNINMGANITTQGSNSFLAPQQNNGISSRGGGVGNSLIETRGLLQLDINGYDSEGITSTGGTTNQIIIHDDASILMRGTNSRGMHVNDGGHIISEANVSIRHEGTTFPVSTPSVAVYATSSATGAGSIILNNLEVTTLNANVPGVVANGSTGNGAPSITINGTANINILGDNSDGVGANESGIVTINNANITALGTNGVGIGTRDDNGIITIFSGQINANLYAVGMYNGNNQQINLSNINLIAATDIIYVDSSTNANLQITRGTATAANSRLLLNVLNNSIFAGSFSQSSLNGDVFVANNSTSNISLLSNTLLTGRMNGGNTFIDPSSRWLMTSNSNLLNMNNNGIIDFGNYSGSYKLLTNNNYTTNNGALYLNTSLGADNSPTDIMVVQGNTNGTGFVRVTNTNGIGALTQNGIKIIDVEGMSNARFQLIGNYLFEGESAVVGGAYAYRLYQNGISTPTDGDWYLRSSLISNPRTPLYQPGVPIYEAYASVLQLFNRLDTLQQRVGNRSWLSPGKASNSIEGDGFWTRIDGLQAYFEPKFSTASFDYEASLLKYTLGIDKRLFSDSSGTLVAGLAGHYGKVFSDIYSYFGEGKLNAKGYGPTATLTWYGHNGFYTDGQAHFIWYNSDLFSKTARQSLKNNNDGNAYAASIEIGKRIFLNNRAHWSLTPQTQWGYYNANFSQFKDVFGADVSLNQANSLIGRVGLSVDYQNAVMNSQGKIERTHLYGITNFYYDFLNQYDITVSTTPFSHQNYPLWGGLSLGGSKNWNNDFFSIFGEVSANTSLSHFSHNYVVLGKVGVRMQWD